MPRVPARAGCLSASTAGSTRPSIRNARLACRPADSVKLHRNNLRQGGTALLPRDLSASSAHVACHSTPRWQVGRAARKDYRQQRRTAICLAEPPSQPSNGNPTPSKPKKDTTRSPVDTLELNKPTQSSESDTATRSKDEGDPEASLPAATQAAREVAAEAAENLSVAPEAVLNAADKLSSSGDEFDPEESLPAAQEAAKEVAEEAAENISEAPEAVLSAADRLRDMTTAASGGKSVYEPTEQLVLARDRYLSTYLPYDWQSEIRKVLKGFSAIQFSYIVSVASIMGASLLSGFVAYAAWHPAHDVVLWAFSAAAPEARTMQQLTFEAQYLGTVSFVTGTLLGNTFGWTFSKQQMLVAQLSEEVFALELLLQELFIEIPEPYLRWRVVKHIKVYIDDEMSTTATDSPFRADGAIAGILEALQRLKCENGKHISKLLETVEMLARANSDRYGTAASLLPTIHWVLLTALSCLVLIAFILFDSDFESDVAENRSIFAVVAAMLCTILLVLKDLSDPDNGVYSLKDALGDRLSYVRWQMKNILYDPVMKVSMLGKGEELESSNEEEDAAERSANAAEVGKDIRRLGDRASPADQGNNPLRLPRLPTWLGGSLDQR